MKARKIDLTNYKVTVNTKSPLLNKILTTPGVGACLRDSERWKDVELNNLLGQGTVTRGYDVKGSIANILWAMRLPGREAHEKRNPLVSKIKMHDNEVLLDKEEYAMLLKAFEQFDRSGSNEEELLKRVFEAKEVNMEERKKEKQGSK